MINRSVCAALLAIVAGACTDPNACAEPCAEGQSCVRAVCVADCGADVEAFGSALGEGLVPVANFCRSAGAYGVRLDGAEVEVFDLRSETEGLVTTFTLSAWTLDTETPTPSVRVVTSAQHTAAADQLVFAGGYVEVDPSGASVLFGYTTTDIGFPGEVFRASTQEGPATPVVAPSNFDVAWVDADRYVVNGAGLGESSEGQGLYSADATTAPVHAASGFGDYSGSVVVTPTFVLAGGADAALATHVYVVARARFDAALASGTPVVLSEDASASEVLDPAGSSLSSSTFELHGERLIVTPFGGPIRSYQLGELDGAGLALSDPRDLALGGTFTGVLAAGDGRLLLVHADGLLLVE